MRTLVVTQNATVDGSVEFLEDWFDPEAMGRPENADLLAEARRQSGESDAMLLGRRTFEAFRAYWPEQADDPTGISDYLDGVQKYVVSSTLADPAWEGTTVLAGDPVESVAALKQEDGRDIVLTGSIRLAHTLVEAGLVDEYRLFVYPAVQGRGRRLFPDAHGPVRLRLLESRPFRGGVVLLRYAPG